MSHASKSIIAQLLRLSEHLDKEVWFVCDGSKEGVRHFNSLQAVLNHYYSGDLELFFPEFDTYTVRNVCLQSSLLDPADEFLIIYLV